MGAEATHDWQQGVASALEWWRDAGVDALVEDLPRDWLARPAPTAEAAAKAADVASAPIEILPTTLEDFVAWRISGAAPEAGWMARLVAPSGPAQAKLVVMTDAPDSDDGDTLLSGAAGRLFDKMLAAIGLARDSVYVASYALARPVTGRVPAEQEARLAQLARHHLTLLKPERLLLLGPAALGVMGEDGSAAMGDGSGHVNFFGGNTRVAASYHPRFLLDHAAAKSEAWKHLLLFTREGM